MILLGNALVGLATVLGLVIDAYKIVILASTLLSWVQADPNHPLIRFVRQVTEPVFRQIRRRLPASFFASGLDFTPMLVFLILIFADYTIVNGLHDAGRSMLYRERVNNIMLMPSDSGSAKPISDPVFQSR